MNKRGTYPFRFSRLIRLAFFAAIASVGIWAFMHSDKLFYQDQNSFNNQLISEWYELFLDADRFSEGYRAPVSARTMAYVAMAAYESAIPMIRTTNRSFVKEIPGIEQFRWNGKEAFNLSASLNSCYKILLSKYYLTAPAEISEKTNALYEKWEKKIIDRTSDFSFQNSVDFGARVAHAIFDYSATDTVGHQAYLHIYDKQYRIPTGEGLWKLAEDFPMPPLLPNWGQVRPFVVNPQEYIAKPLPEYSQLPSSLFYTEALEILTLSSPLSFENKWIAEFWSDDHPGLTFSPSSRWISISKQVIDKENPPVHKTLETYLKVSLAIADASIVCWKSKYIYNLERPEAYIHKVFNRDWQPLFHSPPFPSYPSGHSIFGAAASEVLTQMYGEHYEMRDNSHRGRTEFMGQPRDFHSFHEMAFENAFSRIYLGVHFRMDCEEGIRLGFQIGKQIAGLDLKGPDFSFR